MGMSLAAGAGLDNLSAVDNLGILVECLVTNNFLVDLVKSNLVQCCIVSFPRRLVCKTEFDNVTEKK